MIAIAFCAINSFLSVRNNLCGGRLLRLLNEWEIVVQQEIMNAIVRIYEIATAARSLGQELTTIARNGDRCARADDATRKLQTWRQHGNGERERDSHQESSN